MPAQRKAHYKQKQQHTVNKHSSPSFSQINKCLFIDWSDCICSIVMLVLNVSIIKFSSSLTANSSLFLAAYRKHLHLLNVLLPVVLVQSQWLLLSRTLDVGLILQQFLNPQQNLLHRNVRLPILLLIQNRQAHCSRRIDVGVWQNWLEYTFGRSIQREYYLTGKSWQKSMLSTQLPPSQGLSLGPGISQCHLSMLVVPSAFSMGLATKPKGWSLLQSLRSFLSLLMTSSLIYFFSMIYKYVSVYYKQSGTLKCAQN